MKAAVASRHASTDRAPGAATTVGGWLAAHPYLERLDREVLLGRAAGLSRAQLLARPERELPAHVIERLTGWAARRRRGEPVAYILGEKEFWGLTLRVDPTVLIPRPETELLVEAALDAAALQPGPLEILELGTGSGAVAIALSRELADRAVPAAVTATDTCADALAVASGNARRQRACIRWLHSDWFANVAGRYQVIVSNPPYVASGDPHLPQLRHEPRLALVAGADGLAAIRRIAAAAPRHLAPQGWLLLEHGFDQGAAVRALLTDAGLIDAETLVDLAGLARVTRARLPGSRS